VIHQTPSQALAVGASFPEGYAPQRNTSNGLDGGIWLVNGIGAMISGVNEVSRISRSNQATPFCTITATNAVGTL
jgi:hypothetical protein